MLESTYLKGRSAVLFPCLQIPGIKKRPKPLIYMVGGAGFEPATLAV